MTTTPNPLEPMATRIGNAYDDFAQLVRDATGCTDDQAQRVTAYLLRHKMAKLDVGIGRISVTWGGYMDADVLTRAVAITTAEGR